MQLYGVMFEKDINGSARTDRCEDSVGDSDSLDSLLNVMIINNVGRL